LVKAGFQGKIYATEPTADLLDFMLRDSAHIQESNAERQNHKRQRRGQPLVEPIYTVADAESTLPLVERVDYERWFEPAAGIRVRYWNAGHILGSASAEVQITESPTKTLKLLFSGDLGPDEKVFHPEPDAPAGYDYIVSESTYGDREREEYTLEKRREAIRGELTRGLSRGGNVVIPSFAVERSQELLHDIGVLLKRGEIPEATVYLDSPLARKATEVFIKYAGLMEDIAVDEAELFRSEHFRIIQNVDESIALNRVRSGAIIISASGMCTAGRIKHHLKHNIWRQESTILFVGYQSPGTLGQIITSGAKRVRIHGKEYQVKAAIRQIGNYSAHADQGELIDWILERGPVQGGLFLNHGDDDARIVLKQKLVDRGLDAGKIFLPQFDQSFELVPGAAPEPAPVPAAHRIDEASVERDWYNDYADFILSLGERLRETEPAARRRQLLARLRETLEQ
jgi:metallo-beta-lactamase family protein